MIFVMGSWLPRSPGAPQVGQKAPDFTLTDSNNKPVTLAQLLTEPIDDKPPKGVLLTFYRGYWLGSCHSELRSIEKNLNKFNEAGIRPVDHR